MPQKYEKLNNKSKIMFTKWLIKQQAISKKHSPVATFLQNKAIYASLKGTPYWGKCPDFNVDGVWYKRLYVLLLKF